MTEATKRPWELEQRPHLRGNEFMIHGADEPSGRTIVYHHELNAPCSVLSKANAAHIIKCVNMHDGLVAALARYGQHRASCTIYGHHGQLCNCGWWKERAKLESALAQHAEPETETVELVVGGEYEVIRVPGQHPVAWIAAKCIELPSTRFFLPLFELTERSWDGLAIRYGRAKGEYRNVQNAEVAT